MSLDGVEARASEGGAGAPPEPESPNRAPDLTREYSTPDITVQWFAGRCIHSANSVHRPHGRTVCCRLRSRQPPPWCVHDGHALSRKRGALSRGRLTRNDLRMRHRRMFRDVYLAQDVELSALVKAHAVWLSTGATLAGISAAAVLGAK